MASPKAAAERDGFSADGGVSSLPKRGASWSALGGTWTSGSPLGRSTLGDELVGATGWGSLVGELEESWGRRADLSRDGDGPVSSGRRGETERLRGDLTLWAAALDGGRIGGTARSLGPVSTAAAEAALSWSRLVAPRVASPS